MQHKYGLEPQEYVYGLCNLPLYIFDTVGHF